MDYIHIINRPLEKEYLQIVYLVSLLKKEEQIARHILNQLIAYATGAEIQFADREERDEILEAARRDGYGLRAMIHSVAQSEMFRNK